MMVTVLVPELLVGKAISEWSSARYSCEKISPWAEKDGVDWSMAHSFFADMGGFVIQFNDKDLYVAKATEVKPSLSNDSPALR